MKKDYYAPNKLAFDAFFAYALINLLAVYVIYGLRLPAAYILVIPIVASGVLMAFGALKSSKLLAIIGSIFGFFYPMMAITNYDMVYPLVLVSGMALWLYKICITLSFICMILSYILKKNKPMFMLLAALFSLIYGIFSFIFYVGTIGAVYALSLNIGYVTLAIACYLNSKIIHDYH